MSSAAAIFDTLYFIARSDVDLGLSEFELQTLDYLACLISTYDGQPVESWEFGFSVTELGSPFSEQLVRAARTCEQAGWIERIDRVYRIRDHGQAELAFQQRLSPNVRRARYLEASSSASLSMTLPSISDALSHEPGLKRAVTFLRRKRLMDETSLNMIESQFADLRAAVGAGSNRESLMVPTVVWLTYLAKTSGGRLP